MSALPDSRVPWCRYSTYRVSFIATATKVLCTLVRVIVAKRGASSTARGVYLLSSASARVSAMRSASTLCWL